MYVEKVSLEWFLGVLGFMTLYTAVAIYIIQECKKMASVRIRKR
jgi:hypothetical protein